MRRVDGDGGPVRVYHIRAVCFMSAACCYFSVVTTFWQSVAAIVFSLDVLVFAVPKTSILI